MKLLKPSIGDIARLCFGAGANELLDQGAIHPILDRRERKAPFIKGVQHGYFDQDFRDWEAVGFEAGELSGIQVIDIDDHGLVPTDLTPNVITAHGAHFYGRWDGSGRRRVARKVDLLGKGNVVFYDDRSKKLVHSDLLPPEEFYALLVSLEG